MLGPLRLELQTDGCEPPCRLGELTFVAGSEMDVKAYGESDNPTSNNRV